MSLDLCKAHQHVPEAREIGRQGYLIVIIILE